MIEVGNIVTLENGRDYLILEEIEDNGSRFVYTVRVLEDETPTSEYVIYEAINSEDGEFLKDVTNKETYDKIIEQFKSVIADKFMSGEYNDMIEDIKNGEE